LLQNEIYYRHNNTNQCYVSHDGCSIRRLTGKALRICASDLLTTRNLARIESTGLGALGLIFQTSKVRGVARAHLGVVSHVGALTRVDLGQTIVRNLVVLAPSSLLTGHMIYYGDYHINRSLVTVSSPGGMWHLLTENSKRKESLHCRIQ
jgi:hypothetical protein